MDHVQSAKEVARHAAHRLGLLSLYHRARGHCTRHLAMATVAARFGEIYAGGAWVREGHPDASSGTGSTLSATGDVRAALPGLLRRLDCGTLLDIGCGDWTWMREVELPCGYIGIDIVPEVIEANRRRFGRPGVEFHALDAIAEPLAPVDMALCREVLFHLSFADALALLANIHRSGCRWLLATTDRDLWWNSDITTGDFRRINLQRRPYRLPEPTEAIPDTAHVPDRVLGLWPAAALP
jgi:SAM-dependent methyltransferase